MNKRVTLRKPFEAHGKMTAEIELKEPSGALYIKLGDPRILIFNASGSGYWVEQPETIDAYFRALIVHDIGALAVMNLIGLDDAMALKGELFGFFSDAAKRTSATPSTP